jgi:branched-chain amino acid transport system ATP-binding protein
VPEPVLAVRDLCKRFGGLVANDQVSLDVIPGEIHAIIGPNGAGKTTLISQIAGEQMPTSGSIRFNGHDITRMLPHRRATLGLTRCFQITSIFGSFSAEENVAIARQAREGHSYRFWEEASAVPSLRQAAAEALNEVGLGPRSEQLAETLAHGEHRQLEIAMALAAQPKLLLLDEPTAGMGREESHALIRLLGRLRSAYTMILIEHDMGVVFALADRITVLANGRVIVTDTPAAVRVNAAVREAYLGEAATK